MCCTYEHCEMDQASTDIVWMNELYHHLCKICQTFSADVVTCKQLLLQRFITKNDFISLK